MVTSGSFIDTGPVAERKTFCQIPVSRSRTAGSQSQPMVERNVGPSMCSDAAVLADAVAKRVFVRNAGMGLRRDEHRDHGLLAGFHLRRNIEGAANKGAADCANLCAIDPDFS